MKLSSVLSAFVIATSTLITFSTAALAISQPKNITTNIELQSLQISEQSSLKIAEKAKEDKEDKKDKPSRGVPCSPPLQLLGLCGWW
jgi:hypothetical protein